MPTYIPGQRFAYRQSARALGDPVQPVEVVRMGPPKSRQVRINAERRGVPGVGMIDASGLSPEACQEVYLEHAAGAFWWKYEVPRVFGTRSAPGWLACREVPLCSFRFEEAQIPMVAPLRDATARPYRTVSILDVLRVLAPSEHMRLFGATWLETIRRLGLPAYGPRSKERLSSREWRARQSPVLPALCREQACAHVSWHFHNQ